MNRIPNALVLCIVLVALPAAAQKPLRWMPRGTSIGLTAGGMEYGSSVSICRASHRGGVHPGRLVDGGCQIGWGGRAPVLPDYEVLTGTADWRDPDDAAEPFIGGREADGREMEICRGYYISGTHPGKVVNGQCNIGWGDFERVLPEFEVLHAAVRSIHSRTPVKLYIKNGSSSPVARFWLDYAGNASFYGTIAPGELVVQDSFATHPWVYMSNGEVVRFDTTPESSPQFIGIHAYPTMVDVEAGPIWSTADAQAKCPSVCSRYDAEWTKEWRTTVWGETSVCQCKGFL